MVLLEFEVEWAYEGIFDYFLALLVYALVRISLALDRVNSVQNLHHQEIGLLEVPYCAILVSR